MVSLWLVARQIESWDTKPVLGKRRTRATSALGGSFHLAPTQLSGSMEKLVQFRFRPEAYSCGLSSTIILIW